MLRALILIGLLAAACPLPAQTTVDRLVDELEFLSSGTITTWRTSTSMAGEPWTTGFDDDDWTPLRIGESITPDSCWLRAEFRVPDRMLGIPVSGPLTFLVSVDDYGYLWVNGEPRGHFPWNGEFLLTDDASPGDRFTLAIKAINTGGPLRLLRARIETADATPLRSTIRKFLLGVRTGQKLLSGDTYQTNARVKVDPGTDRSAMDRAEKEQLMELLQETCADVDVAALRRGNVDRFTASLDTAQARLAPVAAFVRRYTLHFTSNAHIDAAWLWRKAETMEVCKNTFASVLNMMNLRPEFTYTQSSAAFYHWMKTMHPALFDGMRRRIAEGRWEVTGGMWVEPDCNLPAGPSWARHLLYGKRFLRDATGVDVRIGWNPDSFGYNANMPMFYRLAGIDAFITQKIGWNEGTVFPHRVFWWESPDGSRLLTYFPFDYVNTIDDPFRLVDWLRQFEANTGFTGMMVLFGVGDHGGGPSLDMLARIDSLRTIPIFPTITHGTAAAYLAWLKDQGLDSIPVWTDELYLEYHQGTFTTQGAMKERNRRSEALLLNAEAFSTLASRYGRVYPHTDLADAWRPVLFNQFHDILPGSSIREVYIDAAEDDALARRIGEHELEASLSFLAGRVATNRLSPGTPVVVFNPTSWTRTDIAAVDLPPGMTGDVTAEDSRGRELPVQRERVDRYRERLHVRCDSIPAFGYTTILLKKRPPKPPADPMIVTTGGMENRFFRMTVDTATGLITSLTDKRSGRDVLAGPANRLQLLEDRPSAWDAWNIGLTGTEYPLTFRSVEVVETGPVRAILRITQDYRKPGTKKEFPTEDFPTSFFTQEIILYADLDRIDFRTNADWWEEKTMLKVAFPVNVTDTMATYDIPWGAIRRSTQNRTVAEQSQVEVPAYRWADLSAGGHGVSLLNRAKHGHDIKGNVMRLSLLRSPKWPDPTADRGKHSMEYALYPHAGDWREAGTHRRAAEFNLPLLAVVTPRHPGPLPPSTGFLSAAPGSVTIGSLKQAEDGEAWIITLVETAGTAGTARITLPARPRAAAMTDFLEQEGAPLTVQGQSVLVPLRASGVQPVRVTF